MRYPRDRGDGLLYRDPRSCSLRGVVGARFGKHPWVSPAGVASGVGREKAESYGSRRLTGAWGWGPPAWC